MTGRDTEMTGMSFLRPAGKQCLVFTQKCSKLPLQKQGQLLGKFSVRNGGSGMPITPSRYDVFRFRNDMHFYLMLGAIPTFSLIAYCNIFIGPAELAEIPEGYEPKEYEYHEHPIKRWMAKYVFEEPQKMYEKNLDALHQHREEKYWKQLTKKVKELQSDRLDYRGWYFTPVDKDLKEYDKSSRALAQAKMGMDTK